MKFMTFNKLDGSLIALPIHHVIMIEKIDEHCSKVRMNNGDECNISDNFQEIKECFEGAGIDFWN